MAKVDLIYGQLINKVLDNGVHVPDRTGVGTKMAFGEFASVDVSNEFPLVTIKKTFYRGVFEELLWFLQGGTNAFYLAKRGVNIWVGDAFAKYERNGGNFNYSTFLEHGLSDENFAKQHGELGPIYGSQWVNWQKQHNQIQELVDGLKHDPYSRRHLVTAWNPVDVPTMTLPPCHYAFQVNVRPGIDKNILDLIWNQRSVDIGLGWVFNIASYAALTYMLAQQVDMTPGVVGCFLGNIHIYNNHIEPVREMLKNCPMKYNGCKLELNKAKDIFSYDIKDFNIVDYESYPTVKMQLNN
jgi:thymidylate synthase